MVYESRKIRVEIPQPGPGLSEHYLHWLLSINQGTPESIVIKQNWRIDPFVATPEEYAKIQSEWDPILARSGLHLVISSAETEGWASRVKFAGFAIFMPDMVGR